MISGLRPVPESPSVWCLFKGKKKRKLQFIYSTREAAYDALETFKSKKYFIQQYVLCDLYIPMWDTLVLDTGILYTNANMEALNCSTPIWKDAIDSGQNFWVDADGKMIETKKLGRTDCSY